MSVRETVECSDHQCIRSRLKDCGCKLIRTSDMDDEWGDSLSVEHIFCTHHDAQLKQVNIQLKQAHNDVKRLDKLRSQIMTMDPTV